MMSDSQHQALRWRSRPKTTRWAIVLLCVVWAPAVLSSGVQDEGRGAVVVGTVVDGHTGEAVAGAVVSLRGAQAVRSDQRGHFALPGVPRGRSYLEASKPGFVGGKYGQRSPTQETSGELRLEPTDAIVEVNLRLWQTGVMAGAVVDEFGSPVVGTDVVALLERVYGGEAGRYFVASSDVTDDRGFFRVPGLAPGRYLLAVPSRGGRGAEPTGYPTEYYPGSYWPSGATPLLLSAGQELAGLNMTLRDSPGVAVTGRVVGLRAASVGPVSVRLVPVNATVVVDELDAWQTVADEDGAFRFADVLPGSYAATVSQFPSVRGAYDLGVALAIGPAGIPPMTGEDSYWGSVSLAVGDTDVADLQIPVNIGARIMGSVRFVGLNELPSAVDLNGTPISVRSVRGEQSAGLPLARIEQDGTFRTVGLPPGEYTLSVIARMLHGWTVQEIDTDADDPEIGLFVSVESEDRDDVVIVMTREPTRLVGEARAEDGEETAHLPVYVFPVDPRFRRGFASPAGPWRLREAVTDRRGLYEIAGLVPGEYYVLVCSTPVDHWKDPERLASLVPQAERVELRAGERQTLDLRPVRIQ